MTTRLTWLGHGAWQVETAEKRVLIDPFLTGNPAAAADPDELAADFILVSHGHGDHVGDTVGIAVRTGATVISNFEIATWVEGQIKKKLKKKAKGKSKKGSKKSKQRPEPAVHAMNTGGAHDFPFGNLKLTIAHHTSMLPDGTCGGNPCGFILRLADGRKIYHAADTGLFGDMQLIGDEGIDLAIVPIGDNYTMGPDDALRAVRLIRPKRVIPQHFNTWDLIAQDAAAWAARVKSETTAEPIVLKPGEAHEL